MLIVCGPVGESGHEQPGHPERPGRITAVLAGIGDLDLGDDIQWVPARAAEHAQLTRVHSAQYLDELRAFCESGGGNFDPDTYASFDSWSIALHAAGAGLGAIDALKQIDDGVAFVVVRPPGHHALADRAMGFCLLNNIAVAAKALVDEGERVLIVDWDVHHGNGTQEIFWNDPNVLYVSTHQSPLFPGSGREREIGGPGALDRTINLPVPPKATGDVLQVAFEEVVAPVVDQFNPTWVLVSAGFDAHRADPLADLGLSSGDFAQLARTVARFSPRKGRLALFLEGGYDLDALRMSVAATVGALIDSSYEPEAPTVGGPGIDVVHKMQTRRREVLRQAQWSETFDIC